MMSLLLPALLFCLLATHFYADFGELLANWPMARADHGDVVASRVKFHGDPSFAKQFGYYCTNPRPRLQARGGREENFSAPPCSDRLFPPPAL